MKFAAIFFEPFRERPGRDFNKDCSKRICVPTELTKRIMFIMRRIIAIAAIGLVAILSAVFGYEGPLGKVIEHVPSAVTDLVQAVLAVSALVAIIDSEVKRWSKHD